MSTPEVQHGPFCAIHNAGDTIGIKCTCKDLEAPYGLKTLEVKFTKPVTPLLAVDLIIMVPANTGLPNKYILIRRMNDPKGVALPGGFVDVGEAPEKAAIREAKEETNVSVILRDVVGIYGDPERDKRGHVVSIAYLARASKTSEARAGSDAKDLIWVNESELRTYIPKMVFDHGLIIADYLCQLKEGKHQNVYG